MTTLKKLLLKTKNPEKVGQDLGEFKNDMGWDQFHSIKNFPMTLMLAPLSQ